jgi:hypothetical protein
VSKRKHQTAVIGLHSVGDKWKTGVELGGGTMTLFRGSMGMMGTDGLYYKMPSTAPDEGSTLVESRKHQDTTPYTDYIMTYSLLAVILHTHKG